MNATSPQNPKKRRILALAGAVLALGVAGFAVLRAHGSAPDAPPPPPIYDPPSYACRQILVAWKGASHAPPAVTRSKEEARERARAIVARVRAPGASFADVAKETSDEASSARDGGFIGFLHDWPGMASGLVEAAGKTPEGGTSDPVETAFGFHVIQRISRAEGIRLEGALVAVVEGFMIPWHAISPGEAETRTKDAAYADAAAAVASMRAGRETLDLAVASHDGRQPIHDSLRAGGTLPGYAALAEAAVAVKPGEYGDPVETPEGWAVFYRRIYFRARVRHILILHQESRVPSPPKGRTVAEAEKIAADVRKELGDDLSKWPDLVHRYSEEPASAKHGGSMGDVSNAATREERLAPELEARISFLKPGEVSGTFASRYGIHILWRVD